MREPKDFWENWLHFHFVTNVIWSYLGLNLCLHCEKHLSCGMERLTATIFIIISVLCNIHSFMQYIKSLVHVKWKCFRKVNWGKKEKYWVTWIQWCGLLISWAYSVINWIVFYCWTVNLHYPNTNNNKGCGSLYSIFFFSELLTELIKYSALFWAHYCLWTHFCWCSFVWTSGT
jgi:hypothetical protein